MERNMMYLNVKVTAIVTLGLVFLGSCSSSSNQTPTASSPAASPAAESQDKTPASSGASAKKTAPTKTDTHGGQGGQVIESGIYHLELLTVKESDSTHIDFFLQKGDNHEPIPNAKVTAQVQLPDGSQKSLNMKYDTEGKHYTAILSSTAAGEYKAVILTDINGEKVNGRFSFQQ
jgi:hypothetical protein